MNRVWGSNADPTDIKDPDLDTAGKLEKGWEGNDIPPHTYFNFEQNRQSSFNNHVNIEGIPVWDSETPFVLNSYTKSTIDGRIYRSLTGTELSPNIGNEPSANPTEWKRLIEVDLELVETPVNTTPADSSVVTDTTPTLRASVYKSLYGLPHLDSEFRVSRTSDMTDIAYVSGSVGSITAHELSIPLALDDTYYYDVRYQDEEGTWSGRSIPTSFSIPLAGVQTPTILSPTEEQTNVESDITVSLSAFAYIGAAQTHVETTLEIATDLSFSNIIDTVVKSSGDLENLDVTGLPLNTTLYIRAKYQGSTTGYSDNSEVVSFLTLSSGVLTPAITSPTNNTTGIGSSVAVTSTAFAFQGTAQTQDAVQYVVYTDEALTNVFYDSGVLTTDFQSHTIMGLSEGRTNYWLTKADSGDVTGFSPFSAPVKVTTLEQFADWSQWDGTADGSPFKLNLDTDAVDNLPNKSAADIGSGRFVTVSRQGSQIRAEVVGTFGTSVGAGGPKTIFSSATPTYPSVVSTGIDKAVVLFYFSGNMHAIVLNITGSAITFSSPFNLSLSLNSSLDYSAATISEDKILLVTANTTITVGLTVLTTSGLGLSQGVTLVDSSVNQTVPNGGLSVEVRNNIAVIVKSNNSGGGSISSYSLDTGADTATLIANTPLPTGDYDKATLAWIDDSTLYGLVWVESEPFMRSMVIGIDGSDEPYLISNSLSPFPMNSSGWGVSLELIGSSEFMVNYYDITSTGDIMGTVLNVASGIVFYGDPITIDNTGTSGAVKRITTVKRIDDSRLLSMYSNETMEDGISITILNGEAQ